MRPESTHSHPSTSGYDSPREAACYFHSRRIKRGHVEKPWLETKEPNEKWITILPALGILVGLCISGFLIWEGLRSVIKHQYKLVLSEDWSGGFDASIWTKEVQVGGFGNGEFEQTTGTDENVYVEDGHLFIEATLQDPNLLNTNCVLNLTADGTCTSFNLTDCVAATNTSAGNSSLVPPVKSGRVNTLKGATLKYGRVEVTAKLPEGDWLWPAIWMLPTNNTYGPWPASGEIDIMESRGNNYTYLQGGNNIMSSALHWGPNPSNDGWWRTNAKRKASHTTYSKSFNTFGLEWSKNYAFTYVNSRLLQVLYAGFDQPLWYFGLFPDYNAKGERLVNPWQVGGLNAPFDGQFYLILSLAVGGTNGWFQDGQSGKPWLDSSEHAKKDFWNAQDQWYPTWTNPTMEISKVEIWQQDDGDEDL